MSQERQVKRITSITEEQRARLAVYAQEWIERGWRTGALSVGEWEEVDAAVRACYGHAGLPVPRVIVHVPSPLVGALAAPIAAHLLAQRPVHGAVDGAVGAEVRAAVGAEVRAAVDGAVGAEVRAAVYGAVDAAVDAAVGAAVRAEVYGAVDDAVDAAVDAEVRGAVDDAVDAAVDAEVRGAVRAAVSDAVRDAVRDGWWRYFAGQHWSAWPAYLNAFFDVLDLDLPDMAARARDYAALTVAGHVWMWPGFAVVADRPVSLHVERVGPDGWGSHRLHNPTGPAVAWADGFAVHAWHGTRVPADLIEGEGWDVDRILTEPNAEVRRCAIERIGWDAFITAAGLAQVGPTVPDPGNPGQGLALYDVPARIYGEPVRVLLCTNGTVERDGTRRRFGLTVPATVSDPIAAAAWGYDLTPEQYTHAARRA